MKIAVIGTGVMGSGMAEGLLKAGQDVVVYNRTAAKTEHLVSMGAKASTSVSSAISSADAVIIVLLDAATVKSTLQQPDVKASLRGKMILNATTTNFTEIAEIVEIVRGAGGKPAECSMLSGAQELKDRKCDFLLASESGDQEFWTSVLKNVGGNISYVGEVGRATMAESPMIFGSMFLSAAAAYSVAVGLKLNVPHDVIKSQLAVFGPALEPLVDNMLSRNYDTVMASVDSFLGACQTGVSTAKQLNMPTAVLENIASLFAEAKQDGLGPKDGTVIMEMLLKQGK
ncbi:NAD(P)-dependent_oxidoreductase [Hexamita inflata]|uniref:NAD(P)-dependent_oxidoreductase n=1 Tax=Hexamita inflata TaxID=28002 RepID=A0ABP1HDK2_9EUKA